MLQSSAEVRSANDARTPAARSRPEPGVRARDARAGVAGAQPPRSRDDGDPRRHAAPARPVFGAGAGAFSLAVSGTGTSGMEAAVANVTRPAPRAGRWSPAISAIGWRRSSSATAPRSRALDVEWGRACDPAAVERALGRSAADIVAVVHAETSTGVLNPGARRSRRSRGAHGALTIVDAVTSLGGDAAQTGEWGIDVCYSCSQKGLGAPSGLAPITFSARALRAARAVAQLLLRSGAARGLLGPPQVPPHDVGAARLRAARGAGRRRRRRTRGALGAARAPPPRAGGGLEALGLSLLPPAGERLWTLNAVRVPDGVDEAAVRRRLLDEFNIEIGAGLGPLAGRIWRVGLMGAGSTLANVLLFLTALERVLRAPATGSIGGAAVAAAEARRLRDAGRSAARRARGEAGPIM